MRSKSFGAFLGVGVSTAFWIGAAVSKPLGDVICASATSYLASNQIPIRDGLLLFAEGDYPNGNWTQKGYDPKIVVTPQSRQLFLAYYIARRSGSAGAVSAKISRKVERETDKTNYVDLYRPEIVAGSNSCERRGRSAMERRVRVNQYIDYHNGDGTSSSLEDFHFRYPQESGECARTDDPSSRADFQFDGVKRTQGDTFFARNFSFVGTAYAIDHEFAVLKSELHYRREATPTGTCVGLAIPIGRSSEASVVINERGFGGFPGGHRILIGR